MHIRHKKLYSSVRKSTIMSAFDSTNILDRLEKTWKIIFSSHWKTLILPPILITAIGYTILVILFLWGGMLWYTTYQWINPLEYGIEQPLRIISILLFLLAILVLGTYLYAYFVTYIFIAADLISRWGTPDFKETHEESFHKIWSWFWYMLWYSIIIIWLIVLFILGYLAIWNTWFLSFPIFLGILIWVSIAYYIGMPQYILTWKKNFHEFIDIYKMTRGRWWVVFGNIIGMWIIVALTINIVQAPGMYVFSMLLNELLIVLDNIDGSIGFTWVIEVILTLATVSLPIMYLFVVTNLNVIFQMIFFYIMSREILDDTENASEKLSVT